MHLQPNPTEYIIEYRDDIALSSELHANRLKFVCNLENIEICCTYEIKY